MPFYFIPLAVFFLAMGFSLAVLGGMALEKNPKGIKATVIVLCSIALTSASMLMIMHPFMTALEACGG